MPSIEKRVGNDGQISYRVKVRLKGSPTLSSSFARLTDARKWGQRMEVEIRSGRHIPAVDVGHRTVADMLDRYEREVLPHKKSKNAQATQFRWWRAKLGPYLLTKVTPALIVQCREALRTEPVLAKGRRRETTVMAKPRSAATVCRYLAAISHAFSIAVREWNWIDDSPMRKVTKPREPRGRVRFLSDDERVALLRACKASETKSLYAIVVLALSTGMRLSELMNLRWADVDLVRGVAILHETKNGERRVVPVAGHALALLLELDKGVTDKSTLLFPSRRRPEKPFNFRKAWNAALTAAGIVNFRFHDLRHSAASYLAMGGASPSEMAKVLGHRGLAMTIRYAHLGDSHTHRVVSAMNDRIFPEDASDPGA